MLGKEAASALYSRLFPSQCKITYVWLRLASRFFFPLHKLKLFKEVPDLTLQLKLCGLLFPYATAGSL